MYLYYNIESMFWKRVVGDGRGERRKKDSQFNNNNNNDNIKYNPVYRGLYYIFLCL